jgi:hypothetical protein
MPVSQSTRENIARGKPASQSSRSVHSVISDPQGGVDGIKNGRFGFHTALENSPWWQVDLRGIYAIEEIVVYNRLDACADRAKSMRVFLSEDGEGWQELSEWQGGLFGGIDGNPLRVRPRAAVGRFVRLRLTVTNYFHLDEVEVFGVLQRALDDGWVEPDAEFNFSGL